MTDFLERWAARHPKEMQKAREEIKKQYHAKNVTLKVNGKMVYTKRDKE